MLPGIAGIAGSVGQSVSGHRYWRFKMIGGIHSTSICREMELYDAGGKATVTAGMLSKNDIHYWNAADFVDGNIAGGSGMGRDGFSVSAWFKADFGSGNEQAIIKARLYAHNTTINGEWALEYSDNDTDFTEVARTLDTYGSSGWHELTWTL